jgi:hypothetical protein
MKVRKKPVEVEAWTVRQLLRIVLFGKWTDLPEQVARRYEIGEVFFRGEDRGIEIKALEGLMTAAIDDWIICGIKGELYPCKPDIFAATYEPVYPKCEHPTPRPFGKDKKLTCSFCGEFV